MCEKITQDSVLNKRQAALPLQGGKGRAAAKLVIPKYFARRKNVFM